jgi:glycosyltransferase involved in cell wall biosynthesis
VRDLGNVRMMIYGDGFFRRALEEQVKALGLEGKVVFGGWVSETTKYEILAEGDIGLILHRVCDLTQHTVPNKLFDYMSVGLPVVSTRLRPVTRILEVEQCGIAVDETLEAVATGIKALILDMGSRKRFADNGYSAVRARYRWEGEVKKIITGINTLTRHTC